jgi:diaminohydroxyphosphoribosylaminopyrimidine deaminase/5-amino-6-(5-phosphoribosylamino)uracil reductase
VLVEGGSEVLGSAIDEGIGDSLVLFVAGKILGGRDALPAFGGRGAARLGEAVTIHSLSLRRLGADYVLQGELRYPRGRTRS